MKNLDKKVAIVSGGARDIGKAISLKLAAEGAKVVVNYFNNAEQGAATVKEITDAGGTAIAVAGDMTKATDVEKLVSAARKAYGDRIDVLVNVVGGLVARKPLAEMDEEFLDHVMKLNLNSSELTGSLIADLDDNDPPLLAVTLEVVSKGTMAALFFPLIAEAIGRGLPDQVEAFAVTLNNETSTDDGDVPPRKLRPV